MGSRQATIRILLYSHDTYGLGHLRRSLRIAGALAGLPARPATLVLTGSPKVRAFPLPPGCDVVKLPSMTKSPGGAYRSRTLDASLSEVVRLRSAIVKAAVEAFDPQVVLVDHAPAGASGELMPLLERGAGGRRLVLGLRDVVDAPRRVLKEWRRLHIWRLLDDVYSSVLVYGDRRMLTTAEELGLPDRLGERLQFTGYLGCPPPESGPQREAGIPTILVTAGGGGDGHQMLRAYAAFLEDLPAPAPFRSHIVTGPLLSQGRQEEMAGRFARMGHPVSVSAFSPDLPALMARSAGVIAMGGYNTVVELLAADTPALIVPRVHPRLEQLLRARRLAPLTGLRVGRLDSRLPSKLAAFVRATLDGCTPPRRCPLDLDGLPRVAAHVAGLAGVPASGEVLL